MGVACRPTHDAKARAVHGAVSATQASPTAPAKARLSGAGHRPSRLKMTVELAANAGSSTAPRHAGCRDGSATGSV
jgi:hypothetical protein